MRKIARLIRTKNNVFEYWGEINGVITVAYAAGKGGDLDLMVAEGESEENALKDSIKRMASVGLNETRKDPDKPSDTRSLFDDNR